jgi:uncharacterized protein (TIGR03067 family)
MRRVVVVMLLLGTLPVSGAPAPFPRAERQRQSDLDQLQGEWALTGNGKARLRDGERYVIRIARDELLAWEGDDPKLERWGFKLNAFATPKRIDLMQLLDENNQEGEKVHAIYRLHADTLTMCVNKRGKDRPTEFDPDKQEVLVFTRLKR